MGMKNKLLMFAAMGAMMGGSGIVVPEIPEPKYKPKPKLDSIDKRKEAFFKVLGDQNERCQNQQVFTISGFVIAATTFKRANMKINSLLRQFHLKIEDFNEPQTPDLVDSKD